MTPRVAIRVNNAIFLVDPSTVECVESCGKFVRVRVLGGAFLTRAALCVLERLWSAVGFARVHRSYLVNLEHVVSLRPCPTGEYVVNLRSGSEVTLSRSYRKRFFGRVLLPDEAARSEDARR